MKSISILTCLVLIFNISLGQNALDKISNRPLEFIQNQGQIQDQNGNSREDVLFSGKSGKLVFHLRQDGISYQLYKWAESGVQFADRKPILHDPEKEFTRIYRIDINWIGANLGKIQTGEENATVRNYYNPRHPEGINNVSSYQDIAITNLYDGIDMKYYENQGSLEYDFILSPGANYRTIAWNIEGAKSLTLDENGQLLIETPFGTIAEAAPIAYQGETEIEAAWNLNGNTIGFEIGDFDETKTLIIDPIVRMWGTYYGGSSDDYGIYVVTDDSSNVYISGVSSSASNIATTGAHQTSIGGSSDAFVAKIDGSGNQVWGTYYGGTNYDEGRMIALNSTGDIYMTGYTFSSGLATIGAHQTSLAGSWDGLLVKFNSNGVRQWATYYGGTGLDIAYGCSVDGSDRVYIQGYTGSTNGMATSGTYQDTLGGDFDAFVAQFSSLGARIWGSYFGGPSREIGISCTANDSDQVYITGYTSTDSILASSGAHQSGLGGGSSFFDAFVAKFDANGGRLWSTYYGGSAHDYGYDLTVDPSFNVYLTGEATSSNNIASSGSHQATFGGGGADAYLAKFTPDGTRDWGTYYGSDSADYALVTTADNFGYVYITGETGSTTGIASNDGYQTNFGGGAEDAFLVKFGSDGVREVGTFYGGTANQVGYSVAIDGAYAYLMGYTESDAAMVSTGSHQTTYGGGLGDVFLAKFMHCTVDSSDLTETACFSFMSPGGNLYDSSGIYTELLTNEQGCDSVLTINLTITTIDTSVTQNGQYIVANQAGAMYQWLHCEVGFMPIAGATNHDFFANSKGIYAVEITLDGCIDTSSCHAVMEVGIEDALANASLSVYPNPASDLITIESSNVLNGTLTLQNILGEVVMTTQVNNSKVELMLGDEVINGIYFVRFDGESSSFAKRVVVKK